MKHSFAISHSLLRRTLHIKIARARARAGGGGGGGGVGVKENVGGIGWGVL
jgi:hypothetical protein